MYHVENKLDGISQQCKETYLALREFTETKQYFSNYQYIQSDVVHIFFMFKCIFV